MFIKRHSFSSAERLQVIFNRINRNRSIFFQISCHLAVAECALQLHCRFIGFLFMFNRWITRLVEILFRHQPFFLQSTCHLVDQRACKTHWQYLSFMKAKKDLWKLCVPAASEAFIMGIVYKLWLLSCYWCHGSSAWMKLHWFREALQIVSVCSSLFARTEPEKYEAQTAVRASLNSVLNNPYIVLQITQCSWISYCSRLQHSRVIFHLDWVLYRF